MSNPLDSWWQDVRYAVRALRRSPGFTCTAILVLALGIGGNTTMFSVLYGVVLRPLPYPAPEQMVQLAQTYGGDWGTAGVTSIQFDFLEDIEQDFVALAAATTVGFNLYAGDAAERVGALRVTPDYFRVVGIPPAMGRGFLPEEDRPGGPPVAVVSHRVWQNQLGGDSAALGRTVELDGRAHTVIGIMPPGFTSLPEVDVWAPIAPVATTIGSGSNLSVLGRLAPGVTHDQAQARFAPVNAVFLERFTPASDDIALTLLPYRQLVADDVGGTVRLLVGAVGFVLLIACANVASLLLGRASARGREFAVRVAVGASRGRLIRQVLTESVLLALAGGVVGVLVAEWGLSALLRLVPADLPRTGDIRVDLWALAFTFGVALLTGVAAGVLPAWHAANTSLAETLKESSTRATGTSRQGRIRSALVVGEIALSLMLLVGAGLMLRTFANLVNTDPGFDADGVVAAEIWLSGSQYESSARVQALYTTISERVNEVPGVRGTAVVEAGIPLQRGGNSPLWIDGEFQRTAIEYRTVTPGYLPLIGVPLLRGRQFNSFDREDGEPVILVNQAFAERFFEDEDPVGRSIQVGGSDRSRRIVGVVGDMRSFIGLPAGATTFIPSAQTPVGTTRLFASWFPINVIARAEGNAAALRAALPRVIREVDPQVPVGRVRTMHDVLNGSLAMQRFIMVLLGVFAALALVLAGVGVYGVMAYFTAQQTHEIGVRMALGALPRDVLGLVLRRGVLLTAAGVLTGLIGARLLTRFLGSVLYGVGIGDPLTFAAVALGIALLALVASAVPAWRAARVDPMIALRHE